MSNTGGKPSIQNLTFEFVVPAQHMADLLASQGCLCVISEIHQYIDEISE